MVNRTAVPSVGALLLLPLALGCSTQRFAIRTMAGVLEYGIEALYEESDLILAEQAIAGNLKLIEGLIKADPENADLLFLASQGYASYALGFVEDEDPIRAREFYRRGRDYGFRHLHARGAMLSAENQTLPEFQAALAKVSPSDVAGLFWTANAWGNWVFLSMREPAALAQLPRVELMMRRVLELDERFFWGGPHLFFGIYFGGRSRLLGGDPGKARDHFEACLEIGDGKFLLPMVFYAKFYAVQNQDRELFESLLKRVLDTPPDVLPEQALPNAIARRKAEMLLAQADDLF